MAMVPSEGLKTLTPHMTTGNALGEFEGSESVGSASHSIHRANRPLWTPTEHHAIQDQLSHCMHHSGNAENMWFDDDLVSALMEPIMMPGANNHSTDMTFGPNSTARAFISNGSVQSETLNRPQKKLPRRIDGHTAGIQALGRSLRASRFKWIESHPLRQNHNSQFDISSDGYKSLKSFLQRPACKGFDFDSLPLPELGTANVFIRLFFAHFEYQVPVIHHPSLLMTYPIPC